MSSAGIYTYCICSIIEHLFYNMLHDYCLVKPNLTPFSSHMVHSLIYMRFNTTLTQMLCGQKPITRVITRMDQNSTSEYENSHLQDHCFHGGILLTYEWNHQIH